MSKSISEEEYAYLNYLDLRVKNDLENIKIIGHRHKVEIEAALEKLEKSNAIYNDFANSLSWWMRFIRFCGGEA